MKVASIPDFADVHVGRRMHDVDLDVGVVSGRVDPTKHPGVLLVATSEVVSVVTRDIHTMLVLSISCTSASVRFRKIGAFAADSAVFSTRTTAGVITDGSSVSGKLPRRVKLCAAGSNASGVYQCLSRNAITATHLH